MHAADHDNIGIHGLPRPSLRGGPTQQALDGNRVVSSLPFRHGSEIQTVQFRLKLQHGRDICLALGHGVFPDGKGVKVDALDVPELTQTGEQLEGGGAVYRPNSETIVRLPVAIV